MILKCDKCQNEFSIIGSVSFSLNKALERVFTIKEEGICICDKCGSYQLNIVEDIEDYSANFAKFSSMNDSDKKIMFKKRAKEHYDKNNGAEMKLHKQKQAISKMLRK